MKSLDCCKTDLIQLQLKKILKFRNIKTSFSKNKDFFEMHLQNKMRGTQTKEQKVKKKVLETKKLRILRFSWMHPQPSWSKKKSLFFFFPWPGQIHFFVPRQNIEEEFSEQNTIPENVLERRNSSRAYKKSKMTFRLFAFFDSAEDIRWKRIGSSNFWTFQKICFQNLKEMLKG